MFIRSFKYAVSGIVSTLKSERNFRIMLIVFLLVITAGCLLKIAAYEWIAVLFCSGVVLALELMNTALESAVNLTTNQINPMAKKAKDAASGAVLVWSIFSSVIGLIIFVPKLLALFSIS